MSIIAANILLIYIFKQLCLRAEAFSETAALSGNHYTQVTDLTFDMPTSSNVIFTTTGDEDQDLFESFRSINFDPDQEEFSPTSISKRVSTNTPNMESMTQPNEEVAKIFESENAVRSRVSLGAKLFRFKTGTMQEKGVSKERSSRLDHLR